MSVIRSVLRMPYRHARNVFMVYSGLHPRVPYVVSETRTDWTRSALSTIPLPNLSGHYNPILRAFWERHGLGARSLLVSEDGRVAGVMHGLYPNTEFTTCDLFSELQGGATDYRWDVCMPPPEGLSAQRFGSVIAYALLEHVIDPTCAIAHCLGLLEPGGFLYGMTHTPSFHLHRYPRDYCRFHHDYFEDLPLYALKRFGLAVRLVEMHSAEGTVCFCYQASSTQPAGAPGAGATRRG